MSLAQDLSITSGSYGAWTREWYSTWTDPQDTSVVAVSGNPLGAYAARLNAAWVNDGGDTTYRSQMHAPGYGSNAAAEIFKIFSFRLPNEDWPTTSLQHCLFYEEFGSPYALPGAPIIIGFDNGDTTRLTFANSAHAAPAHTLLLTPVPRDTWITVILGIVYGQTGTIRCWLKVGSGALEQKSLYGSLQPTLDLRTPSTGSPGAIPHPIAGPYYSYSGGVQGGRREAFFGGMKVFTTLAEAQAVANSSGGGADGLTSIGIHDPDSTGIDPDPVPDPDPTLPLRYVRIEGDKLPIMSRWVQVDGQKLRQPT
jgi:hypothetical protein